MKRIKDKPIKEEFNNSQILKEANKKLIKILNNNYNNLNNFNNNNSSSSNNNLNIFKDHKFNNFNINNKISNRIKEVSKISNKEVTKNTNRLIILKSILRMTRSTNLLNYSKNTIKIHFKIKFENHNN